MVAKGTEADLTIKPLLGMLFDASMLLDMDGLGKLASDIKFIRF